MQPEKWQTKKPEDGDGGSVIITDGGTVLIGDGGSVIITEGCDGLTIGGGSAN